jgi:hypothetical protein
MNTSNNIYRNKGKNKTMSHRCDSCGSKPRAIVWASLRTKFCGVCYKKNLRLKKSLIKKLPEVESKPAPLGYKQILSECVIDPQRGQAFCNSIYLSKHHGSVN